MTIYEKKGFENRTEYLESLCEEYEFEYVYMLASMFGPEEDFDGLVSALEESIDL